MLNAIIAKVQGRFVMEDNQCPECYCVYQTNDSVETGKLKAKVEEYAGRILSQIKEIEELKARIQQLKSENAREEE